jgi:hypothetical protein
MVSDETSRNGLIYRCLSPGLAPLGMVEPILKSTFWT